MDSCFGGVLAVRNYIASAHTGMCCPVLVFSTFTACALNNPGMLYLSSIQEGVDSSTKDKAISLCIELPRPGS
jgi:hypothetical protein